MPHYIWCVLNYSKRGMLSIINNKYAKGEVKNIHYVLNFYKHKRRINTVMVMDMVMVMELMVMAIMKMKKLEF